MENDIEFLFSRLVWPSGMVRERACTALAQLIIQSPETVNIQKQLLIWISNQKIESIVAVGLLVFIKANLDSNFESLLTIEEMIDSVKTPSLLSHILLQELASKPLHLPDNEILCSASAPPEFKAKPFFHKYVKNCLPPVYVDKAEFLERKYGAPFIRQWSYEWQCLNESLCKELSTKSFDFWGRENDKHFIAFDSLQGEIYRSAYLRALAWGMLYGFIPEDVAKYLALKTCPVDLGLWKVKPIQVPEWWPILKGPESTIDTIAEQIWKNVSSLWEEQKTNGHKWAIAHACGRASEGKEPYDLEIVGIFQKCLGTSAPNAEEIFSWYKSLKYLNFTPKNALYFEGKIEGVDIYRYSKQFDDWAILPVALHATTLTTPRWQFWRLFPERGIYLPNPILTQNVFEFSCIGDRISIKEKGEEVAKWNDWAINLQEKMDANLAPSTGEHLLIDREKIKYIEENTKSVFCWLCRLKSFFGKDYRKPYQLFSDYRIFGGSNIILL